MNEQMKELTCFCRLMCLHFFADWYVL